MKRTFDGRFWRRRNLYDGSSDDGYKSNDGVILIRVAGSIMTCRLNCCSIGEWIQMLLV